MYQEMVLDCRDPLASREVVELDSLKDIHLITMHEGSIGMVRSGSLWMPRMEY